MRAAILALIVATLVLYPREAWVSGSSEVEVQSRHFVVRFESVRKIFGDSRDESRWHAEWRAKALRRLAEIRAAIDERIPALSKDRRWRLAVYDAALPEVCDRRPEEPPVGPVRCHVPVRRPFGLTVIFALERLPSQEAVAALGDEVAKIVAGFEAP